MTGTPQNVARWGRTVYGWRYASTPGALWGSGYIAGSKGSTANAKSDTQFLSTPGSIETDASQLGTDMTLDAGAVRESSSTRTALDGSSGFEFAWVGTIDAAGSNERMHYRGTGTGNPHFAVFFFGGTVAGQRLLAVQVGGTTFAPVLADGFTATHDVAVQVAARPNPLTTGASDALVYEAAVVVDGAWYMGQETGPAPSSSADEYVGGGAWNGAAVTNQPLSTTAVRVSSRFHTMTEFGEDFVQSRNAGGTAYELRRQPLAAKRADGIGNEGEWFGQPQYAAAADAARSLQRRLYGPLWCEVFRVAEDRAPEASSPWAKVDAFGDDYTGFADLVRWVPVPPGATHLQVHIQANNWADTGGGVADLTAARDMGVKVYSLAALPVPAMGDPTQFGGAQIAPEAASVQLTISGTDNQPPATFPGSWYDLGLLQLTRSPSVKPAFAGTTFLAVSLFDESETGEGRLRINAIRIVPLTLPEFDEGQP